MAEANWYWAEGEKQNGPTELVAIARLVAGGQLGEKDLIWKEGMAEWIPIGRVPALVKYLQRAKPVPAPVVAAQPVPIEVANEPQPVEIAPINPVGYYNPSGTLPPRAAAALRQHAQPRGDVGDWPLDDPRVAQFDGAWKLRKQILAAASLFKLMLLLTAIADVFAIFGVIVAMSSSRGGSGPAVVGIIVATAVCIGVSVLYYFAWKSTTRSQAWAPLTMGILFVLGGLLNVGSIAMAAVSSTSSSAGPMWVASLCVILFAAAFAYVSFRAFFAIPKYLCQPAWCQELLSKTDQ